MKIGVPLIQCGKKITNYVNKSKFLFIMACWRVMYNQKDNDDNLVSTETVNVAGLHSQNYLNLIPNKIIVSQNLATKNYNAYLPNFFGQKKES